MVINIDKVTNQNLLESCIDEQVLQEMHFSKKDLQDPATIDKILKRKGVFEDIIKYTTWLFAALNVVAGIVVKIELKKHDMSEAGAIGFGVFAILELILIKIHELVGKLPAKAYEKNMEKYKKQIMDLIEKMKKKIQEDPDNANEYKKIIKNCEAVLAEIDKREKTAKKQELRIKVRYVERCYNTLKRWWGKPHCFDFNDGEAFYNEYSHPGIYCLNLAKEYGISEKQIIDRALLIDDESDKGYCDPENIYEYVAQWLSDDTDNEADELKKKFNNSKIHLYYMPDEWPVKFIVVNQKKIYDIDWLKGKHYPELVQGSVWYDPDYKLDKEALIEFDKLQGFYKFSECPDAVKQKDFLEELNKKSSVKESTDMVVNINESLFKRKEMSPLEQIEDMYKKFKAWWNKPHTLESLPGQKHSGITAGADLADALTYDSFQIAEAYGITESQIATRFIERAPKYTTIINQENYKKMYTDQGFNVPKMEAILKSEDLYNIAWDGNDFMKYVSSKTKKVYEAHESEGNENSFKPSKIYEGFHYKIDKEALKEFDAKYGFYKFSKCPAGETKKDFIASLDNKSSVKESVEETITEGFGIDKSQKASLSDLELSYDRKFNAFCLSVSSYSPEKLRNTLIQKQNALTDAQKEKKEAKDRYAKLAAQLKIDYLKNTIDKTNALINKKSKAVASATPKKKAVSESVEVLNELFGKKWKADKEAKSEPSKPTEPKRKYANLTKEEFEKCMSIIKTNVGKYPRLKKVINYDHNGCYSTYQKYIDFDEDEVVVAFLEWGEYDNEIKDEDKLEKLLNELDKDQDKCYASISKEFSQLSFKVEFETVPDAEFDCLCINSRKPLESTNEGFFDKKPKAKLHEFTEAEMSKIMADAKSVLNQAKFKSFKSCVTLELETNRYYKGIIIGHINTSEAPFAYSCGPDKMFDELDKDKKEFAKDLKDKLVADKLCVDEVTCAMQIMVIPGKEEE